MSQQALRRLFQEHFSSPATEVVALDQHASARRMVRLRGTSGTAIGVIGNSRHENETFIYLSQHFARHGLRTPTVYGNDAGAGAYLVEDFGDRTLLDHVVTERGSKSDFPASAIPLYQKALESLVGFQVRAARDLDFSRCYEATPYAQQALWDLYYFRFGFLNLAGISYDARLLDEDFQRLLAFLAKADTTYFMYWDFQGRNIMVLPDGQSLGFLDFQGGRRGPLHYDVGSLLVQAKAEIPNSLQDRLLSHYLDAVQAEIPVQRDQFIELYRAFSLIRVLRNFGTYGLRGLFERKVYFIQSIRQLAAALADRLTNEGMPCAMPHLKDVATRLIERFPIAPSRPAPGVLRVTLQSFSYKNGVPVDDSPHGGGFVFDCRSLTNPGRLPELRAETGADTSVQKHLEAAPEVEAFWQHVRGLVDATVTRYLDRGFDSLFIAFGCTGGRHRSVYFTERMRRHLASFPGVEVQGGHCALGKRFE